MAFDPSNLVTTEFILIIVIFVLFIFALKKALSIIKSAIFIAIASALFPVVAQFLGLPVSADIDSIIFFVTLGLVLYVVYLIAKSVYKVLGFAGKGVKAISPRKKRGK